MQQFPCLIHLNNSPSQNHIGSTLNVVSGFPALKELFQSASLTQTIFVLTCATQNKMLK
jgi:hypothetical protein